MTRADLNALARRIVMGTPAEKHLESTLRASVTLASLERKMLALANAMDAELQAREESGEEDEPLAGFADEVRALLRDFEAWKREELREVIRHEL